MRQLIWAGWQAPELGPVPPERQRKNDRRSAKPEPRQSDLSGSMRLTLLLTPTSPPHTHTTPPTHPPARPHHHAFCSRPPWPIRGAEREASEWRSRPAGRHPQDVSSLPLPSGTAVELQSRGRWGGGYTNWQGAKTTVTRWNRRLLQRGATAAAEPLGGRIPLCCSR